MENVCDFLSAYFGKVRAANLARWEGGAADLLCYNPAIQAHLRLCGEVVRYLERCQQIDPHELDANDLADAVIHFSKPLFDFIASANAEEFRERFHVPFGSGGLLAIIIERQNCFTGKRLILNRKGAYEKSLDDPTGAKPLETYLDVIELKKIAESSENWPIFKDTLSIPLPQEPKNLAKYVNWIEQFNEVRKIWAHPYGRAYSDEDLLILRLIESELRKRLG